MVSGAYIRTKEHREKISRTMKGRKFSKKHLENLSKAKKGKTFEEIYGNKADKMRKNLKDVNMGKHLSEETKEKMSRAHKGKSKSKECRRKLGLARIGKHHSKETKKKLSELASNRIGSKSSNWQGGISKLPYAFDFDNELKKLIRKRDGYICQLCGKTKEESKQSLSIHHIDYDKDNSKPKNLISLCKVCNSKVNGNRRSWTKFFKLKLKLRRA